MVSRRKRFSIGAALFAILIAAVIGYFLFNSKNLMQGPQILIDVPQEGIVVKSPTIILEGKVKNVSELKVNGMPVLVSADNTIKQQLVLQPGENTFIFVAKDKAGRESRKVLKIVYEPKPEDEKILKEALKTFDANENGATNTTDN